MGQIDVRKTDAETFEVTVTASARTVHTVTLPTEYHEQLTGGNVSPETLIEKSFVFLLEREPNTSILARFELPLIGRYFPEFEKTIAARLRSG